MSDKPDNYDELENCVNMLRNYRQMALHWDLIACGFDAIREELLALKAKTEWIPPVTDGTVEEQTAERRLMEVRDALGDLANDLTVFEAVEYLVDFWREKNGARKLGE